MKIKLKRIQNLKYDELTSLHFKNLNELENLPLFINLDDISEDVKVNGTPIEFEINLDYFYNSFNDIINGNYRNPMERIDIEWSQLLYSTFKTTNIEIPEYIMYEKETWAYLNIKVFYDLIKLRFPDLIEGKSDKILGKVQRFIFCNESKIDRTGLRWLWVLANVTYDGDFELTKIAREFIDPVKAVYECVLGRNTIVFKAFIKAIKLCDSDSRIKSEFKTIIPKHIRNMALLNVYDSYDDVNELANVISNEIKIILNN